MPIVKASKRDTAELESLACAWQPDAAAWQVTMVWSDEVMPRARLGVGFEDALYRAMRLLRCVLSRASAYRSRALTHAPATAECAT